MIKIISVLDPTDTGPAAGAAKRSAIKWNFRHHSTWGSAREAYEASTKLREEGATPLCNHGDTHTVWTRIV